MDQQEVSMDFKVAKLEVHETKENIPPKEVNGVLQDEPEVDLKGFLASSLYWRWGGRQVIHLASEKGRLDIVQHLIKNGADVNLKDDDGWSPLSYASWMGHLNVVKYLILQNAKINEFDVERYTPIMRATESGHFQVAAFLSASNTRQKLGIE